MYNLKNEEFRDLFNDDILDNHQSYFEDFKYNLLSVTYDETYQPLPDNIKNDLKTFPDPDYQYIRRFIFTGNPDLFYLMPEIGNLLQPQIRGSIEGTYLYFSFTLSINDEQYVKQRITEYTKNLNNFINAQNEQIKGAT